MADNQHFQYKNKLPYFKKIYGKSKLWLKAYYYPRKGHWTWTTKMATMSFKIWVILSCYDHQMKGPIKSVVLIRTRNLIGCLIS